MSKSIIYYLLFITLISIVFSCGSDNSEKEHEENKDSTEIIVKEEIEIDSFLYVFEQMKNDSLMFAASMSIYVFDDSLQEVVFEHNPNLALIPASTMKLLTTATALEYLGAGRNFSTTVQYGGQIIDGHILEGDIYIRGGGDPALGSKYFKGTYGNFISKWANSILALGIDSITGRVIADARVFSLEYVPTTWSYGETGDYYCTAASGLSAYDNRYELTFYGNNKSILKGSKSNIKPFIPDFFFENKTKVVSGRKKAVYFLGEPYSHKRILKGNIPVGNKSYSLEASIPDPPYLIAYQLSEKLKNSGVKIGNEPSSMRRLKYDNDSIYKSVVSQNRTAIISQYSPSVAAIVGVTNKVSNNLFAEHLLAHIGLKKYGTGDTEAGAKAVATFWKNNGVDIRGMNVYDGSGISRYNSLTAKQLVSVILYMKDSSNSFNTYYNSLAISGKSGTLKSFCDGTSAEGKIHAKSGTMSRVRSYAGFVETDSGKKLIFAFTINNYSCHTSETKIMMENFMTKLVEYR